ncbi:DUF1566 domain-containing protein [Thermomonas carbonis]|uniref:DUF1566 domain-containing protein n=1 Tax=Thermomonas carbonis TaxID=1463158 RepID=A0A7G9SQI1_9GAMM|nr:DUF1566 domain-containing protein [Thermomonas carbonis]QNN70106.1 DUF1566 domain-containing protein [Thermomonas carbonis]
MRQFALPAILLLVLASPALLAASKAGKARPDGSRDVGVRDGVALVAAAGDAPRQMPWQEAIAWCDEATLHGRDDWRLPDASELALLHRHRAAIGGFADPDKDAADPMGYLSIVQSGGKIRYRYWSSTRTDDDATGIDFETGTPVQVVVAERAPVAFGMRIRCVRASE